MGEALPKEFCAQKVSWAGVGRRLVLVTTCLLVFLPVAPSLGSTATLTNTAQLVVFEKKFANCSALNKVYPGGVAKSSKVKNKGGATKHAPEVNSKIYEANKGKDRDKDGIACESLPQN